MTIIAIIVAVLIFWVIFSFNKLVSLRNQVKNAFTQIDIQLKRRHDLIPNLINSVKGAMKFEQETLTKVMEARAKAINAFQQGNIKEGFQNENIITQALGKLFALKEAYPELKSNQQVSQLMEELTGTENKITFARQFYNDITTKYNTQIELFPTNLIASMLGFKAFDLFELPKESAERETPKVDLTIS
ncbi:MAG: LemA family protein [Elusimicrobiales bacterium]|nr:LemA family protein [Elusimicrobiales bacterium]HOJ85769.1 LemA family protein [Elusimicrobiales bacterium]HOL61972.1 LemA family protein [Elusimicrobiales bacterium]HPO94526.1 LemA family protein [Elusimicrobiales bacterium]